jgi:hypothetical protein
MKTALYHEKSCIKTLKSSVAAPCAYLTLFQVKSEDDEFVYDCNGKKFPLYRIIRFFNDEGHIKNPAYDFDRCITEDIEDYPDVLQAQ